MFEQKKTLIVVYKDELLMNQLKKLVETPDDADGGVVGTRDKSINIVSWTEKVWLNNKKAGNIQGKILFLGDIKGTNKLIPVVDVMFDDCGVKFGWAGNQAVLFLDPKVLTDRVGYDAFLKKLAKLPVPDFLKATIAPTSAPIQKTATRTPVTDAEVKVEEKEKNHRLVSSILSSAHAVLGFAKKKMDAGAEELEKVRDQVAVKAEEVFRDKTRMKRQMLFYGVIHMYNDGLELFMNQ